MHTIFSSRPIIGVSAITVARRKSVFISAMLTVVIVVPRNVKCTTAFTP